MSGATIGGVVGGVVGLFFGNPQLGFMIGSMIGGAVDPEKFYGPRIGDGMQQTAAVGVPITYGWGAFPTAGNLMFDSGVREVRKKEQGKGGPVTYTYHPYRSYAILICRAKLLDSGLFDPIAGILQVKRNGKIVYSTLPDADAEVLAGNAKFLKDHIFYLGGEAQMPSPVIEQFKGAGNVPAHRDLVYMVADDVDLTDTNGAVPQYEFVVVMKGDVVPPQADYAAGRMSDFTDSPFPLADPEASYDLTGQRGVETFQAESIAEILAHFESYYGVVRPVSEYLGYAAIAVNPQNPSGSASYSAVESQPSVLMNESVWLIYNEQMPIEWVDTPAAEMCAFIPYPGSGNSSQPYGDRAGNVMVKEADGDSGVGPYTSFNNCTDDPTVGGVFPSLKGSYPVVITATRKRVGPRAGGPPGSTAIPDAPGFYVTPGGEVVGVPSYAPIAGTFKVLSQTSSTSSVDGRTQYSYFETGPARTPTDPLYSDAATWTAEYDAAVSAGKLPAGWTYGVEYPDVVSSAYRGVLDTSSALFRGKVLLGDIVADLLKSNGLVDEEFDVADLTDLVDGFSVSLQTGVDAILAPLQQGFFWDAGEWDDKLHCIKRGGDAMLSIPYSAVAASDGPAIEETMAQEVELLRKVNVITIDPAAGYIPTKQTWERRSNRVRAEGEQTLALAIVLDNVTTARIAAKRGKAAWSELRKFNYSLPANYWPQITATDVINQQTKDGEWHRIRLMQAGEEAGLLDLTEAAEDRQSVYTSEVEGVSYPPPTPPPSTLVGPTYFWAGNLPSLRTQDNVPGMYIAASGYLTGWPGAAIMLSVDNGVSYQQVETITQPSTMGALTAPVTADGEPLSVFMVSGELDSVSDNQLANRMNAWAVTTDATSELGQFKTATLTTPRNYDLTDLVRGVLGTTPASHNTGDPFVMVATSIFLPLDISLAGRIIIFKAVTFGTSEDDAEEYPVLFSPLFTTITIEQYTDDAGNPYTDDQNNPYYYEVSA